MIKANWNPGLRELRQFSIGLLIASLVWGGILWWRHGFNTASWWIWIIGPLLAAVGWLMPRSMRYLYLFLTALALPIGWVVGNLMLALIYFGVITPIALVFKLIGRDPLARRPNPSAVSYWKKRQSTPSAARYFNQF